MSQERGRNKMHRKPNFTPDEALRALQEGNLRYASGNAQFPNLDQNRRVATANEGQAPFVTVLSCSDSRVPAEHIFDRGIGDLFVVRVAGNVMGPSELASVEYAVGHLDTPLFVVLGHTKCGAVTAVVESGLLDGNLRGLSEKILPALEKAKSFCPGAPRDQLIMETVKANVWKVIEDAFDSSACIKTRAKDGSLLVLGALYDLHSGRVEWLGRHPEESTLLE